MSKQTRINQPPAPFTQSLGDLIKGKGLSIQMFSATCCWLDHAELGQGQACACLCHTTASGLPAVAADASQTEDTTP